ncbi:amidase [Phaeobacter inhibens]|nr:putative glutamyl-tRNA(Gln) amidotransferase subunit A [Phaeobacter inhibens]AXT23565.1 amidase [Phaeobacter inhibens]
MLPLREFGHAAESSHEKGALGWCSLPAMRKSIQMQEWLFASAVQMAAALQRKTISSRELVTLHLEHISVVNPAINAIVTLAAERALEEAQVTDAQIAQGRFSGPLMGVPVTIKDSFDTEGIVSTYGMAARAGFVPNRDATVVARLRKAGAIVLGKTNTSELTAHRAEHTNPPLHGRTNNPHDFARSPSGSSGGAAAAVAAGCAALDIGSDTGGSIRDPAHVCGVVGIKPSAGLVPRTGHCVSYGLGTLDLLTQVGPMARYVEDVSLALSVISGPDGNDLDANSVYSCNIEDVDLAGLRVAYYTDSGAHQVSDDATKAVISAAAALQDAKAVLRQDFPACLFDASKLFEALVSVDGGLWKHELAKRAIRGGTAGSRKLMPQLSALAPDSTVTAFGKRIGPFKAGLADYMEKYDALLGPVSPQAARLHADTPQGYSFWNELSAHNLSGFPAVTVPAARTSNGLPVGVQIVSTAGRDHVALAVAKAIQTRLNCTFKPQIRTATG